MINRLRDKHTNKVDYSIEDSKLTGVIIERSSKIEGILDEKLQIVLQKIEESMVDYPEMFDYLESNDSSVIGSFAGTEFSNMWRVQVEYKGIMFPATEHGYMYHKFNFDDVEDYFGKNALEFEKIREFFIVNSKTMSDEISQDLTIGNIRNLYTNGKYGGGFVKALSREFEALGLRVDNWEEIKLETLVGLNILKYEIPELREKLNSTKGKMLIEGNDWGDVYWGIDINQKTGLNYLGRTLMVIRDY